jgi:hypothetical protein
MDKREKVPKKSFIEIGFAIGSALDQLLLKGQKYNER